MLVYTKHVLVPTRGRMRINGMFNSSYGTKYTFYIHIVVLQSKYDRIMLYSCTAILFMLVLGTNRLGVFWVVLRIVVSGFFGGHLAPCLLRVLVMKIST